MIPDRPGFYIVRPIRTRHDNDAAVNSGTGGVPKQILELRELLAATFQQCGIEHDDLDEYAVRDDEFVTGRIGVASGVGIGCAAG